MWRHSSVDTVFMGVGLYVVFCLERHVTQYCNYTVVMRTFVHNVRFSSSFFQWNWRYALRCVPDVWSVYICVRVQEAINDDRFKLVLLIFYRFHVWIIVFHVCEDNAFSAFDACFENEFAVVLSAIPWNHSLTWSVLFKAFCYPL